jgi:hypothetical protein
MSIRPPHSLEYASAGTRSAVQPFFKSILLAMAMVGAGMNCLFVYDVVGRLHRAHWAYRDLMQNPRAYGRTIRPEWIAKLEEPRELWYSAGAFIVASTFGLLLAIHLMVSIYWLVRQPERGMAGLRRYRLWKPWGTVATVGTALWFSGAASWVWRVATAHSPIQAFPPFVENVVFAGVFFGCALLPWWWIGKERDGEVPRAGR